MNKTFPGFFAGTLIVMVAAFASAAPLAANAYAIGNAPATGGGYDFSNSLQNLISPFTGFVNSLRGNGTMMAPNGGSGYTTLPSLNAGPEIENTIMGWLGEFDNWFYSVSGINLGGITYVILNALAWTLGLAQQVVNWLLGLFH